VAAPHLWCVGVERLEHVGLVRGIEFIPALVLIYEGLQPVYILLRGLP
jgi:hypothetical protein